MTVKRLRTASAIRAPSGIPFSNCTRQQFDTKPNGQAISGIVCEFIGASAFIGIVSR